MCIVLFMISVLVFEYEMYKENGKVFGNLIDSVWFLFISIMTIGYGEYSPSYIWTRITLVVATFFGLIFNSVFVVCTERLLKFDDTELRAYIYI